MASSNRHSLDRTLRHVFSQRENIDPEPSMELSQLQDEFAMVNIEWQQTLNDIQEMLAKSEQNNKELNDALTREISYTVSSLLTEIVRKVAHKIDHYKGSHLKHSQDEPNLKNSKLN